MDKLFIDMVVASKISDYQIVINKGDRDNIDSHMRFLVYYEGDEITDPTTKKSLGKLEIPKGFFKVQHIQDSMTVLISELRKEKSMFPTFQIYKQIEVEREILENIKIGDKVKIVNKL